MARHVSTFLAVLTVAACATIVLALGADHDPNRPVHGQDKWPKGLADLINRNQHVGGFFVNADDYFYFRGDTGKFNAFLKQYAALEGVQHRLILHPGQGLDKRPWEMKDAKPIDWFVEIVNRAWRAVGERDKDNLPKGYDVTVHLWLGGNVGLEDLDVPLAVNVVSGGEIEKFVAHHEAKQSLVRKEAEPEPPAATPSADP